MLTILQTDEFDQWLRSLRDPIAKARVVARIRSAEKGNFGDWKSVGNGINEMRVNVRPGYRLYYCRRGDIIYVLLCGGDKSTQSKDIAKANRILFELGELP